MKTLYTRFFVPVCALVLGIVLSSTTFAQEKKIVLNVESLTLQINEETKLKATVTDLQGNALEDTVAFFSRSRRNLAVSQQGEIKALKPGSY